MYSWVRYGVAIYLGLALSGAMIGPTAQCGASGEGPIVLPAARERCHAPGEVHGAASPRGARDLKEKRPAPQRAPTPKTQERQ